MDLIDNTCLTHYKPYEYVCSYASCPHPERLCCKDCLYHHRCVGIVEFDHFIGQVRNTLEEIEFE